MNRKVLYISYDGMTDPLGQSQVIPYLTGLCKEGYEFTLLSCEKKERFESGKHIVTELLNNLPISWEPILYTKSPPIFSTLYDFFRLRAKAIKLHKKTSFKIVHCRSYIPSLIGLHLKTKYELKFIFDMRGFWADERVDGKLWNLENPIFKFIYKFFKRAEANFLKNADAIISLTKKGKDEMLTWPEMLLARTEISVIPCCVDTTLFDTSTIRNDEKNSLRKKFSIESENFVLGYLGSIGTWYMLNEMLDFFNVLKKYKPNAKFLFVTYDEQELIVNSALNKGIQNTDIIISRAIRKDIPLLISIFDYSIFFIKSSYSKISSSPTKQGEIMAMGIPIICNEGIGDTEEIVNKYKSGLVVKKFDYEATIIQLINSHHNSIKIKTGASEYFSLINGVKKYTEIYNSLICNSSN